MAEYHFHGDVLRRSEGHPGAVFQAAYNARARLRDERLGCTWDLSRRDDLVHQAIIAPPGAPAWTSDREQLWNRAEAAEGRRCNAQPGRYFDIGLPVELSLQARIAVVREFVQHEFVDRGMVADFALHADGENPHCHLLVTMRELDGDAFARTKQRAWNSRALFCHWREAWDLFANRALAREGHSARIDHRSYEARGINLTPQPKLYRRQAANDGRDHVAERRQAFETERGANGERILRDPTIVLKLVTSRRSTFAEHDVLAAVRRLTLESQRDAALEAVLACPELVQLRQADERGQALYSTKAIVAQERAILRNAHLLARRRGHAVERTFIEQALALSEHPMDEEGRTALWHLAQSGDLALLEGLAGTGKTSLLKTLHLAYQGQGFAVVGAALMGRTAEQLEQETGVPARTLKSWDQSWRQGTSRLTPRHVVILDEAGMVGSAQFDALLHEVRKAGAKLVLVGDVEQLPPIEIGAPMRLLREQYKPARLQTIRRQRDHAWQRAATLAFATGRTAEGLEAYAREGRVVAHANGQDARQAVLSAWARDRAARPLESSLMLAFRRHDVQHLNELARAVRKRRGELGSDHKVHTERGARNFAAGDRILFLRNDKTVGVKNGSLGTIEHIERGKFVVRLDANQRKLVLDTATYGAFDHGYASTVHKSQGATMDRVYVLATRYMDAPSTYVAMSRHRRDVELHYSHEEFRDAAQLHRTLSRVRVDRMAHDVLGRRGPAAGGDDAQPPRTLARAVLRAHSPHPAIELAVAQRLAAARPISALEVFEQLEAIRATSAAEQAATRELARSTRELSEFEFAHRDGQGAHAQLAAQVRAAQERHFEARQRLVQARRDPALRQLAERIASQRNLAIQRARLRVTELEAARRGAHNREVLRKLSFAHNLQARALEVRAMSSGDEQRAFEVVRERTTGATRLLELRDRRGGPLVLAHAEDCARAPDGRALVRLIEPPRSHLVDREPRNR